MICILDGLDCDNCGECKKIKQEHGCILDGLDCDNCGKCEEIRRGN